MAFEDEQVTFDETTQNTTEADLKKENPRLSQPVLRRLKSKIVRLKLPRIVIFCPRMI